MDYTSKQQAGDSLAGKKKLRVVFGDVVLGVLGEGFEYLFPIPREEWSLWL